MSKDNSNLRLLGSPVNLSYRGKKKDDKKNNIRNRPRSALQNSCFTPEHIERYRRPFSADAKESRYQGQSTRSFLKSFNCDLTKSYLNSQLTVKVLAPTTDILGEKGKRYFEIDSARNNKDLCSNVSDYGSEDTYISLGTKIKAKAQSGSKPKHQPTNKQSYLKFRSLHKKNRKPMEGEKPEMTNGQYGMEVKITEKPAKSRSPQRKRDEYDEIDLSPSIRARAYEAYFFNLEDRRNDENALAGRVSFGATNIQSDIDKGTDANSRRLTLSKQQLSLVEEESTQDLDSVPSHNLDSLSPEHSVGERQHDKEESSSGRDTYRLDTKEDSYKKSSLNDSKTYQSFYGDFHMNSIEQCHSRLSSTAVHTDSSSKDSGYPESTANEKLYSHEYSLPGTSTAKKSNSHSNLNKEPLSLDSNSSNSDNYKTFPLDKKAQWPETLNHSRLLYKDFFLKKEGHIALPPHNSPVKIEANDNACINRNDAKDDINVELKSDLEYPAYLRNSTTKSYTSKVIEDYKREIEAINNLHELTLKDIKTVTVSSTPLNVDKIYEGKCNSLNNIAVSSESSQESVSIDDMLKPKFSPAKRDVSQVSTKELIQNYFKVKESDYLSNFSKKLQNHAKKMNNFSQKNEPSRPIKTEMNSKSVPSKSPVPANVRNPTQKTMFTMRTPLSARLDSVQNDKDIDSWISLSSPSPRPCKVDDLSKTKPPTNSSETNEQDTIEKTPQLENKPQCSDNPPSTESTESETQTNNDLNEKSTVLDIYSMLKEIESYADNPVTAVSTVPIPEEIQAVAVKEERPVTPKDNFTEIFEFLEKVEASANDALSVVSSNVPQSTPKLEVLLKLPHTELAQRLVTASLQLEERSCCITLLQESLANHKEQMIQKVSNLEKQSHRNIAKVKQECEDAIKRHQSFIDQLINDKKTLNHRIEQLVDERRSVEERWKRQAQSLEERYKLELRNQHDKMAAAQQVARQRWVRQKAEKIKELTVKGLEGELRDMADRQQTEIAALKMSHAEQLGKIQARHGQELEEIRRELLEEKERELIKERQLASSRMEKQILELELTYQEQRTRLVAEMRAENDRVAADLGERERAQREDAERWKEEQEKLLEQKRRQMEQLMQAERNKIEEKLNEKRKELEEQFAQYKKDYEAEQQMALKKKVAEITAQHKLERDREIEKAIESMDAEAQQGRKELQEAMRRNKDQYEMELKELAETEQATLRRYQDAQARVRLTEERCGELEVSVSQLETRNRVLTEKNTQLENRAEEIRQQCEELWKSRVENLKKEMEVMKTTHEEQMHQLYAKVKVAVARKDTAIQALTRDAAKHQEKITLLEQKLQQQRKDFLKQK